MRIAGCGLFFLASVALMIAVPVKLSAAGSQSSLVKFSVIDGKDINFAHLSRREGLSQSVVEHILQDDQGFIWFGTLDGLNRFDGYTFNQYKRGAGGSKDLSGVGVTALLKDRSGALWIGIDQFLDRLDPVTDTITRYRSDPKDPASLGGRIYGMVQDGAGRLWLGTSNGLDELDPVTGRFTHYRHDPNDAGSLSANGLNNEVKSIGQDRAGTLWVQTSAGLDRFDTKTGKATHYPELRNRSIYERYQIYPDRSGTLWIISGEGSGLATFEPESRTLTRYSLRLADPGLAEQENSDVNRVTAILEDEDGVLWLGTGGNGLIKFDRKHRRLTRYRNDPLDRDSLSNNWVLCLFEDREGNIWAGTGGGGVNRFSRKPPPFTVYRNDARSSNRINQNFVLSAYEDSHGVLWVGNDGVLNAIDQKRGRVTPYRHNSADPSSISDGTVLSATEGPSGTLWFGTYRRGLNRFDGASGQFKSYRHRSADPNSISSDVIFRLFLDHKGVFWIETDQGLNRFDPKTEHFTSCSARFDNPGPIRVIAEDQQGMLWLGTYDEGAYRFNPANGQFRAYKYDPNTAGSLSSNHVNAIYVDLSGTVWIGTERGLNSFDSRGSFTAYFERDGLADDAVRGILEDGGGNLWISTNNGLSKFNPTAKTFRNYHVEDGLAGNEFNSWGAPFKSDRGEVFFPGVDGLTAFFPDKIIDNSYIPPVVLTDFRLFNETVPVGGHSPLKKAISYTDALELSHEQAVFSFEFSALSYSVPAANRYRYRLEGLETEWNETSSAHRHVTYTTLPPGDYVFRVQGSNNRGLWNERGVALRLHILPPWWSTWWFRAICGTLIVVLLWGLYKLRLRSIEQRSEQLALMNAKLEAHIAERQRAEDALRRTQAYLSEAQRLSHTGSFAYDPGSGKTLYWSEEVFRICGLDPQHGIPDPDESRRLVHPDDRERVRESSLKRFRQKAQFSEDYRLLLQDGTVKHLHVIWHPVLDKDGEVAEYVGTVADVTERKQAEDALRRSRAYLTEAQSLSRTGSFGWKPSTGEIQWSEETYRIFQYDPTTKPAVELVLERVHPEDRALAQQAIERASQEEKDYEHVYRLLMPDGSVKFLHIMTHALRDESGSIEFVGAAMDVTAAKRAEEKIRQNEKELRTIIETIPAYIGTNLPDGSIDYVSQSFLDYVGLSKEQWLDWGWMTATHPEDLDRVVEKWRAHLAAGEPIEQEQRIRQKDGKYRWFLGLNVPLRDEKGNIVKWYGTLFDIDDRKRAEEALRKAQTELAHVTRIMTIGELAASIAHEVNQPLSGVVVNGNACLRWLAGDSPNLEEAREAVRRIVRDGKRAGDVIARVRALATKTPAAKERLDMNEAIREVLAFAQDEVRRNRVIVRTELADDLSLVLGDRVQLQQVVLNLVMNGIEAMSSVEERPRELIVRTRDDDAGQVLVTAQDSGRGLDPQSLERIFEAFYTTKHGGMGMGLSISRSIIQNHGGKLWAVTNEGPGASVQFTIPKYQQ